MKRRTVEANRRVIISLTSTPNRIGRIGEVLETLFRQTAPSDGILVNIPYRFERSGEPYEVPEWLNAFPGVTIHRCRDFGPATKLLGALECETDAATAIITVDDDHLYPPVMVETYRRTLAEGAGSVYCTSGFDITDRNAFAQDVRGFLKAVRSPMTPVHVAEGYGSVLYLRGFFDDAIFAILEAPACLFYSDDLYISNYLSRRNIRRITLGAEGFGGVGFWEPRMVSYGKEQDALHLNRAIGTNRERYAESVSYMLATGTYYFEPKEEGSAR
jgi:hypothetical protein